jgi:hypothetical protein
MSSAQANTTTTTEQRIEALAKFLGVDPSDITACSYDECLFDCGRGSYLVLTDEEADDRCRDRITDSLWAFRPAFIASHTRGGLPSKCIQALEKMQSELCEDASPIIEALIRDMDHFVADAMRCDGRGHFLSSYDGNENEEGDFFIYRDN